MKTTVKERTVLMVNGVKLVMDLSAMTESARMQYLIRMAANIRQKERQSFDCPQQVH